MIWDPVANTGGSDMFNLAADLVFRYRLGWLQLRSWMAGWLHCQFEGAQAVAYEPAPAGPSDSVGLAGAYHGAGDPSGDDPKHGALEAASTLTCGGAAPDPSIIAPQ